MKKSEFIEIRIDNFNLTINQNKINLYKEWSLAFKSFGRVVVLNGASSSGKSTLAKSLIKYGFNVISQDDVFDEILRSHLELAIPKYMVPLLRCVSFDDVKKIIWNFRVDKKKYAYDTYFEEFELESANVLARMPPWGVMFNQIREVLFNKAKPFIFSGQNVLVDTVLCEEKEMDHLSYSFNYYPLSVALLYNSLPVNLARCFARNQRAIKEDTFDFRAPEIVLNNYVSLYKGIKKEEVGNNKILEKLNKKAVKNSLVQALVQGSKLFDYLYDDQSFKKAKSTGDTISSALEVIATLIETVNTGFNLSSIDDIYVACVVKFDFLISVDNITPDLIGTVNFNLLLG